MRHLYPKCHQSSVERSSLLSGIHIDLRGWSIAGWRISVNHRRHHRPPSLTGPQLLFSQSVPQPLSVRSVSTAHALQHFQALLVRRQGLRVVQLLRHNHTRFQGLRYRCLFAHCLYQVRSSFVQCHRSLKECQVYSDQVYLASCLERIQASR